MRKILIEKCRYKPKSFINLLASNNRIEDYQNYRRFITVQALRNLEIKFFIAYWF